MRPPVDEQVLRLDVAVDDALRVDERERAQQLAQQRLRERRLVRRRQRDDAVADDAEVARERRDVGRRLEVRFFFMSNLLFQFLFQFQFQS